MCLQIHLNLIRQFIFHTCSFIAILCKTQFHRESLVESCKLFSPLQLFGGPSCTLIIQYRSCNHITILLQIFNTFANSQMCNVVTKIIKGSLAGFFLGKWILTDFISKVTRCDQQISQHRMMVYTVKPVHKGQPRDQTKATVMSRWPFYTGLLPLKWYFETWKKWPL